MAPELYSHGQPPSSGTPQLVKFSPPASSLSQPYGLRIGKIIKIPVRNLIPILVFILSSYSVIRLLRISFITSSPTPTHTLREYSTSEIKHRWSSTSILSDKELKLLLNLITKRAPCNLLIFGFQPAYLTLASINTGGITVFLDDTHPDKINTINLNSSTQRVYKLDQRQIPAKMAYKLLKQARQDPECGPNPGMLRKSKCKLGLRKLPQEVYEIKWDVVLVDGPSGDGLDAPGRMAAIYTASVLARSGGTITNILVHDVHRTIEKWFSWEFLCEENLVSSKGRLWNFQLNDQSNATRFCSR